jgi:hypothetical protein
MSYKLNAALNPSHFLDSTCYSAEVFCARPDRRPIPSAFDSDDFSNILCNPIISPLPMSQSRPSGTDSSPNMPPAAPTTAVKQPVLASLPVRKPSMPPLPRPLNVTAYTQPDIYANYIDSVLTPSTTNAARSSLTTIVDPEALAHLREENGRQFSDLITHEMNQRRQKASSTWVRDVIFPSQALPKEFLKTFRTSSLWDNESECWISQPEVLTESGMRLWLNYIVRKLGQLFGIFDRHGHAKNPYFDRSWDSRTANSGPTGGSQYRKPDLSLLTRKARSHLEEDERPGWPLIQAFAEITKSQRTFEDVVRNIVEKAYLMFESQPFRRYVVALGFFGPEEQRRWALVLVDRSGVVSSSQFSLNGGDGITLARVLWVLSFGDPTYIGIDETMAVDPVTGIVTHITVTGETPTTQPGSMVKGVFKVVRLLHTTSQLSGRATRVWLVRQKRRHYILKDSWPLESRPFSEIRHLLKINQTILNDTKEQSALKHTYPILIVGQELGDSTQARRDEIPDKPTSRVHRRIVTQPVGDPLTSFRSKYELCTVLADVVACKCCHVRFQT